MVVTFIAFVERRGHNDLNVCVRIINSPSYQLFLIIQLKKVKMICKKTVLKTTVNRNEVIY